MYAKLKYSSSFFFNMNKLSLNETKTKYMVFDQKRCSSNQITLTINETVLERVHSIKFLGVLLNHKLDWNEHKIYIKSKISKKPF